jgi:hypothetical protein
MYDLISMLTTASFGSGAERSRPPAELGRQNRLAVEVITTRPLRNCSPELMSRGAFSV